MLLLLVHCCHYIMKCICLIILHVFVNFARSSLIHCVVFHRNEFEMNFLDYTACFNYLYSIMFFHFMKKYNSLIKLKYCFLLHSQVFCSSTHSLLNCIFAWLHSLFLLPLLVLGFICFFTFTRSFLKFASLYSRVLLFF